MYDALKSAALSILRPFVRYLITQGWTYGALAELLKFVYVGEVIALDERDGKPTPTDSRVSLLSGIHRKEVRRLREELQAGSGQIALRHGANMSAQVVAAWVACAAYRDAQGEPRTLPLRAADPLPSFESLVRLVKADMRPRTVLDELLHAGVVELQDDAVRLARGGYVSDLPEDRLAFMGAHIGDHLRATVHNLEGRAPYLEQSVYFDDLPATVVDGVRDDLRHLGEQVLQDAYQRIARAEQADRAAQSAGQPDGDGQAGDGHAKAQHASRNRLRLGVYYYEESAPPSRQNGGVQ
ncbi:MAG: DUF6502 family protein [Thiomonas sp.]|nr:DUF6502 family protein [Thiomonas sp.]